MFKQLILSFALIAAAQASFLFVLKEQVNTFQDLPLSVKTKGFLAYEGGATEWSAGANSHPGAAGTLTTQFSGITVNTGGLYTNHHLSFGITVYGSYWGEYQLTPISNNGGQITYYAVCHNDSNSDFCGYNNVKYLQDFAMEHI